MFSALFRLPGRVCSGWQGWARSMHGTSGFERARCFKLEAWGIPSPYHTTIGGRKEEKPSWLLGWRWIRENAAWGSEVYLSPCSSNSLSQSLMWRNCRKDEELLAHGKDSVSPDWEDVPQACIPEHWAWQEEPWDTSHHHPALSPWKANSRKSRNQALGQSDGPDCSSCTISATSLCHVSFSLNSQWGWARKRKFTVVRVWGIYYCLENWNSHTYQSLWTLSSVHIGGDCIRVPEHLEHSA